MTDTKNGNQMRIRIRELYLLCSGQITTQNKTARAAAESGQTAESCRLKLKHARQMSSVLSVLDLKSSGPCRASRAPPHRTRWVNQGVDWVDLKRGAIDSIVLPLPLALSLFCSQLFFCFLIATLPLFVRWVGF